MEFFKPGNALIYEMRVASALRMRKIHLDNEINEESVFETLYLIDKLLKIDKISGDKEPLELVINSPGGNCYDGLALLGKIKSLKKQGYKIICTCTGLAASMSFMILLAGTDRRCYEYSSLMCHQPSSWLMGSLIKMKDNIREVERLWDIMKDIIKENTNMTEEQLNEIYEQDKDLYLNPQEALELGIIDEIL